MLRKVIIAGAAIAALASLLGAGATGAIAKAPIAPNQYFNGLVNGQSKEATILMVCPGPVGGLGHPAGGQYVSVAGPFSSGEGFTGKAKSIDTTLEFNSPSSTPVHLATLRYYYEPGAISTELKLPCEGSGVAVFTPVMGGETAKAAKVPVQFVNVAVGPA
jgi:hypothetical protein